MAGQRLVAQPLGVQVCLQLLMSTDRCGSSVDECVGKLMKDGENVKDRWETGVEWVPSVERLTQVVEQDEGVDLGAADGDEAGRHGAEWVSGGMTV